MSGGYLEKLFPTKVTTSDRKTSSDLESQSDFDTSNLIDPEIEDLNLQVYTPHRLNDCKFKYFWQFSAFIDKFGESRGVQRQDPQNRTKGDIWHFIRLLGIWFGATCTIPSMTGFFLGPLLFDLSFHASCSAGIFGVFLGSFVAAFGAIMGPRSGLRQIMSTKYQFGWYFSKFIALLSLLSGIGWLIVNSNFAGQLLSAMCNGKVTVIIGMLINFLVALFLAVFGLKVMAVFDTFFLIPLFMAFMLCYICASGQFVTDMHSKVSGSDLICNWISFFTASVGITSSWLPITSDYYLDLPQDTNPYALFVFALLAIFIPTIFVGVLGIGLASSALYDETKNQIYQTYGGAGLIVDSMKKWHGGGTFLAVLMWISLFTNSGITCYSFGLGFQTLARPLARCPRYIFTCFCAALFFILSAVGRDGWSEVISNFLPMIGYWSMIYATILMTETLWFRRHKRNEYQWEKYALKSHFPIMWASMLAFGFGVAGVVLGMDQYYYVGRIARLCGSAGADLGVFLCIGFTFVSYVPLRYLELYIRRDDVIKP